MNSEKYLEDEENFKIKFGGKTKIDGDTYFPIMENFRLLAKISFNTKPGLDAKLQIVAHKEGSFV